jgi:hypothetical protein
MSAILTPPATDSRLSLDHWADVRWRLHNLYWIVTEEGKRIRFVPNVQQLSLLDNLWYLNIVLKSRQHGFTTFIDILALDSAVFNRNFSAGIIAHGLFEARQIFRSKVKFPYDNLPEGIKAAAYPVKDSAEELMLSNGSAVLVGTSMRSGTLQFLHVSEFGKISRRFPEKAKEIVTGAFNTVHPGQMLFVESTAEGRDGYFFNMTKLAQDQQRMGTKLTPLDFRFHFFAWWQDKRNTLDPEGVVIDATMVKYFEGLEEQGVSLTDGQRAWYVKKAQTQGEDMLREHPSTPEEAFKAAADGAYYSKQMELLRARKRITRVDHVPSMPVNTFWDLGRNDMTAIWFHQHIAGEHRFFSYYQNYGEDLAHYVGELQRRGYLYGRHFLPHDAENKNLERNESRIDRLAELGISVGSMEVVPRCENLGEAIEYTRRVLPLCWFDEANAAVGIACLDKYQKEWDDRLGTWRDTPQKNEWIHGADAFRQFAQGWTPVGGASFKRSGSTNRSHRTV